MSVSVVFYLFDISSLWYVSFMMSTLPPQENFKKSQTTTGVAIAKHKLTTQGPQIDACGQPQCHDYMMNVCEGQDVQTENCHSYTHTCQGRGWSIQLHTTATSFDGLQNNLKATIQTQPQHIEFLVGLAVPKIATMTSQTPNSITWATIQIIITNPRDNLIRYPQQKTYSRALLKQRFCNIWGTNMPQVPNMSRSGTWEFARKFGGPKSTKNMKLASVFEHWECQVGT